MPAPDRPSPLRSARRPLRPAACWESSGGKWPAGHGHAGARGGRGRPALSQQPPLPPACALCPPLPHPPAFWWLPCPVAAVGGGRWCDPRLARPRRERPGSRPLLSWSPAAGLEPSRLLHQRREPLSCPGARGAPEGWSRGSAPARCHPRRTGWPQGPERQETAAVFSQ